MYLDGSAFAICSIITNPNVNVKWPYSTSNQQHTESRLTPCQSCFIAISMHQNCLEDSKWLWVFKANISKAAWSQFHCKLSQKFWLCILVSNHCFSWCYCSMLLKLSFIGTQIHIHPACLMQHAFLSIQHWHSTCKKLDSCTSCLLHTLHTELLSHPRARRGNVRQDESSDC